MYYDIKKIYIDLMHIKIHSKCKNPWLKLTSSLYVAFVTFK